MATEKKPSTSPAAPRRPAPKERVPRAATRAPALRKRGQPAVFPIIGIGASAGGLEALEDILHPYAR